MASLFCNLSSYSFLRDLTISGKLYVCSCLPVLRIFFFFVFVYIRYEFQAYTVNLNYQSTLLSTVEEISMVVIGPFFNIVLFCLLVIFSWAIQRLFGTSPNIFSRFIMAYGINVLLDPIWILIVDSALMRSVYLTNQPHVFHRHGVLSWSFMALFLWCI